jgi:hypothetical protein
VPDPVHPVRPLTVRLHVHAKSRDGPTSTEAAARFALLVYVLP